MKESVDHILFSAEQDNRFKRILEDQIVSITNSIILESELLILSK